MWVIHLSSLDTNETSGQKKWKEASVNKVGGRSRKRRRRTGMYTEVWKSWRTRTGKTGEDSNVE